MSTYPEFKFEAQPPSWEFWLARLFGKRIEAHDGEHVCIAYQWRGRLYFVRWEK